MTRNEEYTYLWEYCCSSAVSSDLFMISSVIFFLISPVVHMWKGAYKHTKIISHLISKLLPFLKCLLKAYFHCKIVMQLATTRTFFPLKKILKLNNFNMRHACRQSWQYYVFIETNIQSKMMNTTTMIPCSCISWREMSRQICQQNFKSSKSK